MIPRLPLPSDPGLVVVSAADLDELLAAAFEACNVLARASADVHSLKQALAAWERLSKWCSDG